MGFVTIDTKNVRTKFEVRGFMQVPEIIGDAEKFRQSLYAHAPFSPKFLKGFCSVGPSEYTN